MTKHRGIQRNFRRHAAISAACAVESLEARRLLDATITATVFHDLNGNGVFNPGAGETPAEFYRVYIDVNENGQFDNGIDTDFFTDENGQVIIGGLDPNTSYEIGVSPRDVEGVSTDEVVTVLTGADDSVVAAPAFGIERSNIRGRVFVDENDNGTYDAGEGRGAIRVFLDLNDNGEFDEGIDQQTWTSPTLVNGNPNPNAGNYAFNYIDAGDYNVYVFPAHYQEVIGDNPIEINLGIASTVTGQNFGLRDLSAIGGVVYHDANGNGVRDGGEQLLDNVRVYADLNDNGQFDGGEPSALSMSTLTPQGMNYFIPAIDPGTYTIRVVLPDGYDSTNPASRQVTVGAGEETFVTSFGVVPEGGQGLPGIANDFNGDGKEDIIVTQNGVSTVWYMDGLNRIGTAALPNLGAGFSLAAYADFDGDDKPDLLAYNAATGASKIITLNGVAQKGVVDLPVVNTNWKPVGAGDFNGDGHPDIVWRNATTGQNTTWRMNGTTLDSFKALPSTADLNWFVAGVGDFNNDGNQDIVWRHSVNGRNTAWLMTGAAVPTFKALPSTADQNWRPVAIAKFNNDDIPDVLWIHSQTDANIVWLMTAGQPNFSKVVL